ncbi:Phosphotransferase enzyme family [Legionella busanensis]|uniref:Phosphotransferase enzyme family n=1 Tax=Legionella busanensis TaxID=190655 RepID=A0A378JLI0_9GAMM|nr:phosphotransferase [Legionella busanensis]STX50950.1 Phosphotransferase enzyme family [Legionella busanensis]
MDSLISFYKKQFGLQHATFIRIEHNDTMVAIVYKVIVPSSLPLILKISTRPGDYYREVYFLNYLANKLPVPRLLDSSAPSESAYGAVLMECLSGDLLILSNFSNMAYQVGVLLAKIHANRVDGYGDLIHPPLSSNPCSDLIFKFEEGLAECANHLPQALLERCRHYINERLYILTDADGPCITHRDFRPGNIIVENNKISGIIDWASGRASFAEEDFYSLEHARCFSSLKAKQLFLQGYASVRPLPDYDKMLPILSLSKVIGMIGFMVKTGTWNTSHKKLYQYNYQLLEQIMTTNKGYGF